jgi:beta-glucosidase
LFAILLPVAAMIRAAHPQSLNAEKPAAQKPSAQSTPELERRIDDLIGRMTIEEKLGQMSQSTSMQIPLSDQIRGEIRRGRWGSFLNAGGPKERAEAQRIARTESRLKIPLLFGRDVIHGYRTVFPIPLGQAASWDPDLVQQAARMAALEATSDGIRWTFAPMIDIARDPRWGRIAESLGEDPWLAGALGVAMTKGLQGESLRSPTSLAATAKHFAGYGAVEAGREYNSTWIPEELLRDVYLRPFLAVRNAGIASFMTAFNALNGVPATGDAFLLDQVLRREWKYDGLVVTDYTAIPEMIAHGYAADDADAAYKALRAGVDMEMVSTTFFDAMKSLVAKGQVRMESVDNAVRNILRLKFRLGLFDAPDTAPPPPPVQPARDIAHRLATESVVLLKNEGAVLPLKASVGKIAVIGPLADSPTDQMGTWTMDGRPEDVVTPLAALRSRLGNDRVALAPGLKNSRDTSHDGFPAALDAARSADDVLLFLGEEQILSGEAHSRAFLDLPGAQDALVSEIAGTGKPVIVIILAGRPLTFHAAAAKSRAILYSFHPGTMGGPALADVLFGDAAPSGKLPVTFPRTVGQVPLYYAHLNTGRPPTASDLGIPFGDPVNPVGYRSKYIDIDYTPEYPFGFGLSYTALDYSNLRISQPSLHNGESLSVSAEITNTGSRDADEIVQLYIHQRVASVVRPVRELKGFRRVHIRVGEHTTVTFPLTPEDLAFWNEHNQFVTEPGEFDVWIAPDSTAGVHGMFTLAGRPGAPATALPRRTPSTRRRPPG